MKGLLALHVPDAVRDWRREDALLMGTFGILQSRAVVARSGCIHAVSVHSRSESF